MIQDKIRHDKISEKISAWSLPESDFEILDALKSESDIEITKNTLVIGDVFVDGTLALKNKCFFIVCGTLSATNFLSGYGCSVFLDRFQISKLLHVAQSDAVAYCFGNSSAKYVLSGQSMGCLTLDGAKLRADIIDDYVKCINLAEVECEGEDLVKNQFPDFISEEDWECGDEDFWKENASRLGLGKIDDEEELFELGLDAISKQTDSFDVFDAADKIVASR